MQQSLLKRPEPVEIGIRIEIAAEALQKLWLWTSLASGEVSCLGLVEEIRDPKNGKVALLRVNDFFLVEQTCRADETSMKPEAVAMLMLQLEAQGVDSSRLRCWAHSHATMQVFWSATDNECVTGLCNGEWLLSLVVNKYRQSLMRLDQFSPAHLWIDNIRWEVNYPLNQEIVKQCVEEFTAKVKDSTSAGLETLLTTPAMDVLTPSEKRQLEELETDLAEGRITQDEFNDKVYWLEMEEDAEAFNYQAAGF